MGLGAINRVGGGKIYTFSTRAGSWEKEYESEITLVVDEQIPFLQNCPFANVSQVLEENRFQIDSTFRPVNVIQIVLVAVVRVVLIQRGTVLRISSDDFFWYFIRWLNLRGVILGGFRQLC